MDTQSGAPSPSPTVPDVLRAPGTSLGAVILGALEKAPLSAEALLTAARSAGLTSDRDVVLIALIGLESKELTSRCPEGWQLTDRGRAAIGLPIAESDEPLQRPMSPERLQHIQEVHARSSDPYLHGIAHDHRGELLAEIRRLRSAQAEAGGPLHPRRAEALRLLEEAANVQLPPGEEPATRSIVYLSVDVTDPADLLLNSNYPPGLTRRQVQAVSDGIGRAAASLMMSLLRELPEAPADPQREQEGKLADIRQGHLIANDMLRKLTAECEAPTQDILLGLAIALALYAKTTGATTGGVLALVKTCLRAPMTEEAGG